MHSFLLEVVIVLPIDATRKVLELINRWPLPGLAFIWLWSNQWNGFVSAQLLSSHSQERSIILMLKRSGPKIEPCGTSYSIFDLTPQQS